MIESPLINEIVSEALHKSILAFLEGRFGAVPDALASTLREVNDPAKLVDLSHHASTCSDLVAFEAQLRA